MEFHRVDFNTICAHVLLMEWPDFHYLLVQIPSINFAPKFNINIFTSIDPSKLRFWVLKTVFKSIKLWYVIINLISTLPFILLYRFELFCYTALSPNLTLSVILNYAVVCYMDTPHYYLSILQVKNSVLCCSMFSWR